MTIEPDVERQIIHLRTVEKLAIGSVANMLGIHHSVVRRVERQSGETVNGNKRKRLSDDFLLFLSETLERFPKVKANRLFQMAKARGYKGVSKGHFRRIVREIRPRKAAEAFLRLTTLSGEESQVDWGEFGVVPVEGGLRKLYGFAMTLSHSRAIFLKFFLSCDQAHFEQGFIDSFNFFGGITRQSRIDNLKTGVTQRFWKLIRYNDHFLQLCRHYGFEPVACRPYRGNEKGKIERGIGYIRQSFFEARMWENIDDLNAQALEWCLGEAMERQWRRGDRQTVKEAFDKEKQFLLPLPPTEFPATERVTVSISKTPYARFDTNDYSVPSEQVSKVLALSASTTEVLIYDGEKEIARHRRSFGKCQTIENPQHIEMLVARKRAARREAGQHRLLNSVPIAEEFLLNLSLHGQNMGGCVTSLLKLLDLHGPDRLTLALKLDSPVFRV
jgi:transposase